MTEKIQEFLASEEGKKLIPTLLAGTAGAAAGGIAAGKRRAKKGESRLGHMGRVLTNAAVGAGLAGGSAHLLRKGLENTAGSFDDAHAATGGAGNEGPAATALRGALFSPVTAAAAGGGALLATHGNSVIGAGTKGRDATLGILAKALNVRPEALRNASPDIAYQQLKGLDMSKLPKDVQLFGGGLGAKLDGLLDKIPGDRTRQLDPAIDRLRRTAGVAVGGEGKLGGVAGILSQITRKGPMSTLGQTGMRRAGRLGLGGAAALLPALLGSFVTSDTRNPSTN